MYMRLTFIAAISFMSWAAVAQQTSVSDAVTDCSQLPTPQAQQQCYDSNGRWTRADGDGDSSNNGQGQGN